MFDIGIGELVWVEDGVKKVLVIFDFGFDNFVFDVEDNVFVLSYVYGFVKCIGVEGILMIF